ncbi:MAG: NAD(P)H-hydrate dehydratase [Prochlorotrichaceae cyanobacterium]
MVLSPATTLTPEIAVTAAEMRAIENWIFAAGLPVESLMEKVVGRVTARLRSLYPLVHYPCVGILVGSGHNGGDAISVARELFLQGYSVSCVAPVDRFKPLTQRHGDYAQALGVPWFQSTDVEEILAHLTQLSTPKSGTAIQWWLDGLLGFGLDRPVKPTFAKVIDWLNQQPTPVVSLDLPSGLDSDRGVALGTAVQATHTLCLGLWKRGFWEDASLAYTGTSERIDIGIPQIAIATVLQGKVPPQALTSADLNFGLSLPIPATSHKYQRGQLLLIAGSRRYRGAATLAALGARSSGVGLTYIAVPESLAESVSSNVPEAIVIPCPETDEGAIQQLPKTRIPWERLQGIVCGPGLTVEAAQRVLPQLVASNCPLLLDADALNALAIMGFSCLEERLAPILITPHAGEFRRLFLDLDTLPRIEQAQQAARLMSKSGQAIVILKGAQTVIASDRQTWVNRESTPALARGGSGDVLAGLMGGLLAIQLSRPSSAMSNSQTADCITGTVNAAKAAVYWHSQAALWAEKRVTPLGVNAWHLAQSLSPALADLADSTQARHP